MPEAWEWPHDSDTSVTWRAKLAAIRALGTLLGQTKLRAKMIETELGLEFWHLFPENRCFQSRGVEKMEKTEKGGRRRRRNLLLKKE